MALGEAGAAASMWLALGFLALVVGASIADAAKTKPSRRTRTILIDSAIVLAWSLFVRFVLTEPNILTDGGSGYGRLMRYTEGYGGLAVFVKLFPTEVSRFMWRAMLVPRVVAALSPALLAWVARGLGFGRAVALIAGLALASVPVHAALTTSDLLVGPMSSLQLAGLALVLAARRRLRPDLFAAGVALAAWAMWCRPEGALGLLPLVAASPSFPREWWTRRAVQAVVASLAVFVLLRVVAMTTDPYLVVSNSSPESLWTIAWGSILFSTVLVPVWLWMPAPFAVAALVRRRALLIVLAGVVAGLVPVYLRGLAPDPADTHLETLRYGLPTFAWLALVSAIGIDSVCGWVARRLPVMGNRPLSTLRILAVLLVMSPIAIDHEYLARRYGHAASEAAIRKLMSKIPDGCGALVPDDRPEGVDIEIYDRYGFIAAEAHASGRLRNFEVRPVSDLLEGKVTSDHCWMFLRGPYCYHGFAGRAAAACEQVSERYQLEEIASIPIEFRHHRLVTGPDVRRPPWYMKRMPIALYLVAGKVEE